MGSIRKDTRGGGWQVRYRDDTGRQRTKMCPTKSLATAHLTSIETQIERKTWVDPNLGKIRFETYAECWRDSVSHLRPGTAINVDSRLRRHVVPEFGSRRIADIEPSQVRAWVSKLVADGLSPATISAAYGLFSRIMNTAVIDSVITRSPCVGIKLPRNTSHQEMNFLTAAQVRVLADALDERYSALIYTAAYTGMRWGELAGLRMKNCNLLSGRIDVLEALTEVNGNVAVGPTKTGKSRSVSLPRFLCTLINEHVTTFGSPQGFVFTSPAGLPLRRNFYRREFRPAVLRSELPSGLRFHDLRHTCVALLIANGAHPKEIQERLGHSSIKLTFDRYGHLLPNLDSRLKDGLDELWNRMATGD